MGYKFRKHQIQIIRLVGTKCWWYLTGANSRRPTYTSQLAFYADCLINIGYGCSYKLRLPKRVFGAIRTGHLPEFQVNRPWRGALATIPANCASLGRRRQTTDVIIFNEPTKPKSEYIQCTDHLGNETKAGSGFRFCKGPWSQKVSTKHYKCVKIYRLWCTSFVLPTTFLRPGNATLW